jgi:Xaa-Pro aminopeptidase
MNIDAALAAIAGLDGTGFALGERAVVWPDFPIGEYRRRYERLAALMDREGFDALVLTQEEPVRYLSGYNSVVWQVGRWLPSVFVAARDPRQSVLFCSAFDGGCADGTSWATVRSYQKQSELAGLVTSHLADIGAAPGRTGYEYGPGTFMALPQYVAHPILAAGAAGTGATAGGDGASGGPRDAGRLISALRMVKSPLEIERVRRSVGAAVAGYRAGLEAAHAGMTERELVAVIASTMYRSGTTAGSKPVFVNCVSGRKRYPLVDSPASDNVLGDGDVVFVDGGGASDGYVSDILRIIGIGPLRPEDLRYAEVAAQATRVMIDTVRPGVRVSGLIGAASDFVRKAGVDDAPVGVVAGHGIGLELWERPIIQMHEDPDDDVAVVPGMVLCLEPILAPPHPDGGLAGVFVIEQQVLVTGDGCEVLSGDLPDELWRTGT